MKLKLSLICFVITALLMGISCRKKPNYEETGFSDEPSLPETPYDYKRSFNDHAATLGRVLFYDKKLSLNNSVSCASCHEQTKAFCDNLQFSTGLEDKQTGRNSPSIFARNGKMFWDGRANSVFDLVLRPIKNHVEMKFENIDQLAEKLQGISYYKDLFEKAYGAVPIDTTRIKDALAQFVLNFEFSSNKFNKEKNSGFQQFTASEKMGKELFFGKARCINCHKVNDDGTSGNGYGSTSQSLSFNIGPEYEYADRGVGIVSKDVYDYGKFMVPVLLNAEYTAPYMHDGRFKTLDEVIEHYNSGLKNHSNLDFRLRDLGALNNLTEQQIINQLDTDKNGKVDPPEMSAYPPVKLGLSNPEKKALIDFLKTLSDPTIFSEAKFSNPFTAK